MSDTGSGEVMVHPTAVVEPGAELDSGVSVGPFCFVGKDVRLGARTRLIAHASVLGPSEFGADNLIYPYATLGAAPQDRTFRGEPTLLVVGSDCVFREQVTLHRGTTKGSGVTRVGSRCLLLVGAHVAHDCELADDVVLTNLTTLGGHVVVERGVVCGGQVAVAPYVRLGELCFVAGGARVEHDVPPFTIAQGDRARVRALNQVGITRGSVPAASQDALKQAFKLIFGKQVPRVEGVRVAERELGTDPYVARLLTFLDRSSGFPDVP